ncbi:hypothetical protein Ahy_A05g024028 [Arachis hypogaea]|uniref:NADH:quinone oxidoreductase/Mrp antiporter membrane subunit domain-containing protein n=1 Tax=Arachis hypogaea TaxID=3818 RepID=A0A445D5P6_ARAHY|nr:hypothetical protein Ahy_A05g024028 [Arachis hypogaea]
MYSGQIGPFSCQDILLFFIMWELELIPVYILLSTWGGKKRIGLYSSNEPTLNFETLTNQSYPGVLEIILYGISFYFCCKIADYTLTYMVTGHPRRGTLQHLYAFSRESY